MKNIDRFINYSDVESRKEITKRSESRYWVERRLIRMKAKEVISENVVKYVENGKRKKQAIIGFNAERIRL